MRLSTRPVMPGFFEAVAEHAFDARQKGFAGFATRLDGVADLLDTPMGSTYLKPRSSSSPRILPMPRRCAMGA